MKKKFYKALGIIAMGAIIGIVWAACESFGGSGYSGGGYSSGSSGSSSGCSEHYLCHAYMDNNENRYFDSCNSPNCRVPDYFYMEPGTDINCNCP